MEQAGRKGLLCPARQDSKSTLAVYQAPTLMTSLYLPNFNHSSWLTLSTTFAHLSSWNPLPEHY